jgi:hypothetical protein
MGGDLLGKEANLTSRLPSGTRVLEGGFEPLSRRLFFFLSLISIHSGSR